MEFGHFSEDGAEYVVARFPTPRPWENFISNQEYGLRVDGTGAGYSVLPESPGCRITYSAAGDPFGKVFYLRDRDSARFWSLTWQPVAAAKERFCCRHGLGYTIFEMTAFGVESELRVFVPLQDPVEIWTAALRNASSQPRHLTLFPYFEWHLAPHTKPWDNYRNYIQAHWSENEGLVAATLADPAKPGTYYRAFAAVDPPPQSFDAERAVFIGSGSIRAPQAVVEGACHDSDMPGDGRAMAAFAVALDLAAGQQKTISVVVGFAADAEERRKLCAHYLGAEKADDAFRKLRRHWESLDRQLHVQTPDPRLDRMANLWLKCNIQQLTRVIRERTRGYRDTLQDSMGIVSFDPKAARRLIATALGYQYADGHGTRQFSYDGGPHDLRIYNDSPLWPVFAVGRYLKETGDLAFLEHSLPFFDSSEDATVFEHLRRGVEWLDRRRGHHNLVRIDGGDWCDALDEVGIEGRGVSVWLSQAFHHALLEFAEMCQLRGDDVSAQNYHRRAGELRESIERHAWDGDWYLCAISDNGRRLGARGARAMEIYLNTQSWAAIGRTAEPERIARALDCADDRLSTEFGPLLLDPPFYEYHPDVGRLTVLRPGCGENGTVYVHAAVFYFLANLLARRPDRAMEILRQIAPMMGAQDPTVTYAAPYSYVNSYVGPCHPEHAGRSLTNWYTSSSSWTLFAITDWLLGVRPEYEGLVIDPCLPSDWERARLRRTWRGAEYEVRIAKPKGVVGRVVSIEVDGAAQMPGAPIPPHSDGQTHVIEVEIGPG